MAGTTPGRRPNTATIHMVNLTNMACYVSPTREPRGLGSGWGPARFARSRGRNGVAMSQVRPGVCASYYRPLVLHVVSSYGTRHRPTKARPSRVTPTSYPRCHTPPTRRNSQFNPVQYSSGLLIKGPQKNAKRESRVPNSLSPGLCLPSIIHTNQVKCGLLSDIMHCFFFLTWPQGHWR